MLAPLFLTLLASQSPNSLTLYRGCEIPGLSTRYWAAEDTILDSKQPDVNFGGALFLQTGPNKPFLIRFGDLNRAIGAGKKIKSASIKLAVGGGGIPLLRRASRILQPWTEGPVITLAPFMAGPVKPGTPDQNTNWSVTWKNRHAGSGSIPWQDAGASGTTDIKEIPEAKLSAVGEGFVLIEGLEKDLQFQLDHPLENCGFKFDFDGTTEFSSCQSATDRPRLILELEDAQPSSGADLSVTYISESPPYERFATPKTTQAEQDGAQVGVPEPPVNAGAQHWPADGEQVTYTAHIKNVGSAPASAFTVRWSIGEKPGAAIDIGKSLAPGEETTVNTTSAYKFVGGDHRTLPIQVSIEHKSPDACTENDALKIPANGLCFGVVVSESAARSINQSKDLFFGRCFEDWMQAQIGFLNEVAFPQSRFSFARNGILERIRIQSILVVPDSGFEEAVSKAKQNLAFDGVLAFGPNAKIALRDVDREVFKEIGAQLGLLADYGSKVSLGNVSGAPNPVDQYPGIMGFGDTRNEAIATTQAALPYGPYNDPIFSFIALEHTDLFSATDTAALNMMIGKRRGVLGTWNYRVPTVLFATVKDYFGAPLANIDLAFYPVAGGSVSEKPAITLKTGATGVAILPKRPTDAPDDFQSLFGTLLRPNAFGRIDFSGGNGAYLVKATQGGSSDWAYFKLWQVFDTLSRNPMGPTMMSLRFNLSDLPVDYETEYAKGRIITDSAQSLPAQLSAMVDGSPATLATVSPKADSWIEIDLGRDRGISEIELISSGGPFWKAFTLAGYATGQTAIEAEVFAQEVDWPFSFQSRGAQIAGSENVRSVAYRFKSRRVRFIRIVNKSDVPSAELAEIRIHPPKGP